MKNSVITFAFMLIAIFTISSSTSFAMSSDKVIVKAQSVVDDASPDDWKTLADQASILVRKNKGMTLAKTWLEKSISIHECPYNLEVMGDYYAKNNLSDEAIAYFIRSSNMILEKNINANTNGLQQKIMALK